MNDRKRPHGISPVQSIESSSWFLDSRTVEEINWGEDYSFNADAGSL